MARGGVNWKYAHTCKHMATVDWSIPARCSIYTPTHSHPSQVNFTNTQRTCKYIRTNMNATNICRCIKMDCNTITCWIESIVNFQVAACLHKQHLHTHHAAAQCVTVVDIPHLIDRMLAGRFGHKFPRNQQPTRHQQPEESNPSIRVNG